MVQCIPRLCCKDYIIGANARALGRVSEQCNGTTTVTTVEAKVVELNLLLL